MIPIALPLIVAEGLDVRFFRSLEAAEQYLEIADVVNGVYRIFDSHGRRMTPRVRGNVVELLPEEGRGHAQELEDLLRQFLHAV